MRYFAILMLSLLFLGLGQFAADAQHVPCNPVFDECG